MLVLVLLTLHVGAARKEVKKVMLDIPPRFMWGWDGHSGYCGSCSTQVMGIFYGEYISQDRVRRSVGTKEEPAPEILWDKNFRQALDNFDFEYTFYEPKQDSTYADYVVWVKKQLSAGVPVIAGIFGVGPANLVHDTYDHIIPIIGYESDTADPNTFLLNDVLYFFDLDANKILDAKVLEWAKTRVDCNKLWDGITGGLWCLQKTGNYGVAVRGHKGKGKQSLPVRLSELPWKEPDYSVEDQDNKKPVPFTAKVTCGDVSEANVYALLRYNNTKFLPNSHFLDPKYEENYDQWWEFRPKAIQNSFSIQDTFRSDSTMFYRCVELPHHKRRNKSEQHYLMKKSSRDNERKDIDRVKPVKHKQNNDGRDSGGEEEEEDEVAGQESGVSVSIPTPQNFSFTSHHTILFVGLIFAFCMAARILTNKSTADDAYVSLDAGFDFEDEF